MSSILDGHAQHTEQTAWFVPGRIEVLGKHTDYAGGRSLLAAVDRGHTVRGSARTDGIVTVTSTTAGDTVHVPVTPEASERIGAAAERPAGHWSGYVRTVVDRLTENFPGHLTGADLTIGSDLPMAAGMSSSSALVVSMALALMDLGRISGSSDLRDTVTTDEALGEYLGTIENGQSYGPLAGHRGVGTFGGSEDHTSMLCAQRGTLVQYAFCPVRREDQVALPEHLTLVVGVSGVQAEKTGAVREKYNAISLRAREVLHRWNTTTGRTDSTLGDAVAACGDGGTELRRVLADAEHSLRLRLDQFLEESETIIPQAVAALGRGDLEAVGSLTDRSHTVARTHLGNQVPQTIALQSLARTHGAWAASPFGAGFGGAVWALVDRSGAEDFAQAWIQDYRRRFPGDADAARTLLSRPGPAAHRL